MTASTRTFTLTITAAPVTGSAPSWFPPTPLQWKSIPGANLNSVWQGPMVATDAQSTIAENGMAVDQAGKKLLIVANGGHDNGYGNEGFELNLNTETPGWVRLNDRTPEIHPVSGTPLILRDYTAPATNQLGVYGDGQPRAMHTVCHPRYVNGRVWFPMQNSLASAAGGSTVRTVSYDVDHCRAYRAANGVPVPWTDETTVRLPWRDHGPLNGYETTPPSSVNATLGFGPCVVDSQDKIWLMGKNTTYIFRLDPVTATSTRYNVPAKWDSLGESWCALIPAADPSGNGGDLLVTVRSGTGTSDYNVYVMRLGSVASDSGNARRTYATNGASFQWGNVDPQGYAQNWGAFYHAASKSIYCFNHDRRTLAGQTGPYPIPGWTGNTIRRLKVPLNANGTLNEAGSWVWSDVSIGGESPLYGDTVYGTHTRFNIIKDFAGAGQDAAVFFGRQTEPTYIMRLPTGDY